MPRTPPSTPESSRERLLVVAETTIAEQGLSVALRDIAIAAGQRNNSAVQYYFGDRDGLLAAIVDRRLRTLEERRAALLDEVDARGATDDPRTLVRILVVPMVELTTKHGAMHYARFLEQARSHRAVRSAAEPGGRNAATVRVVVARLARGMRQLDAAGRDRRLESMSTVMFALLADRERALESGATPDEDHDAGRVDEIVEILVAMLGAPDRAPGLSADPDPPRGSPRGDRTRAPRRS